MRLVCGIPNVNPVQVKLNTQILIVFAGALRCINGVLIHPPPFPLKMLAFQHVLISLFVWILVLGLGYFLRDDYLTGYFNLFALVSLLIILFFGVLVDVDHFSVDEVGKGVSCALSNRDCVGNLDNAGFLHSKWFGVCVFLGFLAWCVHILADFPL